MSSARRATSRWTTWSAWPRRSACRLTSCSSPELRLPASQPQCCPGEPRRLANPCGSPYVLPRAPPESSHVPRHRSEQRQIPSGPPSIPSDTSPVSPCPQAATAGVPPPKPRTPHFQLGTVTPLGLALRPKRPAREALGAATGPKRLAPEAPSPCARGKTGGKPLGTRDTPLTSGGAPVTRACAQGCFARGPQAAAGVRAPPPRAQAQTPCAPAPSAGKPGSERGAPA